MRNKPNVKIRIANIDSSEETLEELLLESIREHFRLQHRRAVKRGLEAKKKSVEQVSDNE